MYEKKSVETKNKEDKKVIKKHPKQLWIEFLARRDSCDTKIGNETYILANFFNFSGTILVAKNILSI